MGKLSSTIEALKLGSKAVRKGATTVKTVLSGGSRATKEVVEEVAKGDKDKGHLKNLLSWTNLMRAGGPAALYFAANKLTEKDPQFVGGEDLSKLERPELKALLAKLQAMNEGKAPPAVEAMEEIAGLDSLLLAEREVASQAPAGTPPATPILDRLKVLMPDLLPQLRQRMAAAGGGLWAELTPGEVLIDGSEAPKSRAEQAAQDQQLELTLREETGFARQPEGPGRSAAALLA